ncbi:FAD-dependent oxidoreductase [Salinilacihabitans rarus]|uniref:oxidoreductase n=1 Tax=Salinilacihabitans rarus TaxID=2961596 RepID=UPI0020C86768|nr:FAD-dependent oxidoreductase [Salinilacihabitans rarus]
MTEHEILFEPTTIGEMDVRNRLVMPPMGTNYADENGAVTERMLDYYAERARGGVGMVVVEVAAVEYPAGKAITRQLRIDDDKYVAGLSRLADRIGAHGARSVVQIHHAGRQTTTGTTEGVRPVAPSAVPDGFLGTEPRPLEAAEVEAMTERFVDAAERAQAAGFDGVELHAAHGYLVGQFISSRTNRRDDRYGGDLEGRMTFPLDIVDGIRERVGDGFTVGVRLSADEFVEGGNDLADAKRAASTFEESGVDYVSVTSGIYESMPKLLEPMRFEEGWRTYLADEIGDVVDVPTIAVGSIRQPSTAAATLEAGHADLVAVGRGLIADPHFPRKAKAGRVADINRCIGCNLGCLGEGIFADRTMGCTVNPTVGREREFATLEKAPETKRVLVAGGGPAGAEAAAWAAVRGHDVTLYEEREAIGGQLELAAAPPGRGKIEWFREHLERELDRHEVDVRLGERLDRETVERADPDAVVVATGARPGVPDVDGAADEDVLQVWDVLTGAVPDDADSVAIVGAGQAGIETAEFLADRGIEVTLLEMRDEIAPEMEAITRFDVLERYGERDDISWHTGVRVTAIEDGTVVAAAEDGTERRFEADAVALATGSEPNDGLVEALADVDADVYVVGDAREPGNILHAVEEGCETGLSIGARYPTTSPTR